MGIREEELKAFKKNPRHFILSHHTLFDNTFGGQLGGQRVCLVVFATNKPRAQRLIRFLICKTVGGRGGDLNDEKVQLFR